MQAPEPSSGGRKQDILRQALKLKTPLERAAFLDDACGGDAALLAEMDAWLAAALNAEAGNAPSGEGTTEATPTLLDETPLTEGPGTVIGRYKLLEQIGEGGFGVVYVAEQREPVKRRVALKIIKLGMDTRQVVARFEAERQALALMDHPNIAKVLDAGATDAGRPFFVMELVKGIPITKYCDQEKVATRERLDLFIKVCHAIQHAHQKGIIHRDIKPSNILVTLHDGVPVPKVIDFGIAKATQQELTEKTVYTQFQQFIGTPAYMSPEQAEMSGLDIDTRSDIYSLGVLLYELLTGSTPFDTQELLKSGLDEMRKVIREREPVRPSTRLSQTRAAQPPGSGDSAFHTPHSALDTDLDWIVMKCLEKDRTRRYETANGVAQDIERHLNHEPVLARPPSTAYRVQKFLRRNKIVVGAAGAVAAVLVLGILASTWQAIRATQAEREQSRLREQAQTNERKAQTAQANEAQQRRRAEANERTAQTAQANEAQERRRAEAQAYVANIRLAQQADEQNDGGQLAVLLAETANYPSRGFEWYYLQRQMHLDLKTLHGHSDGVESVALSPDSQRIVTGSLDGTVKVWDAASGHELLTFKAHDPHVHSVVFSPDGQRIVTGSCDNTAKVWDAASGRDLLTLQGHDGGIFSVAFSPDGRRIATGSGDATAKVWDAASGKPLLTLNGHSNITSVAFSPDGRRVATGGMDMKARVWDAASGDQLSVLTGHVNVVQSVAFSPDGQRIVTCGGDLWTKVWDAATGQELLTIQGRNGFLSAAFSPDGQRIATGNADSTAQLWDAASGKELFTLKGHSDAIWSVGFSLDGRRLVTGSHDRTAKVWDAASGKELLTLKGHTNEIYSAAFSPDGRRIATGGVDQTAKVWDAATGTELITFTGHRGAMINSVAFSPDGQRIVSGGDDAARLWEAATGSELVLPLKGQSQAVAFSPDGRRIVTGGVDGTAKVWDAASGKELPGFKGHNGWIGSVAYSPDGQRVVTGSTDHTSKLWDAASGKELLTFKRPTESGAIAAFSPDGQRIVTSGGGMAKVWEAATVQELAAWQSEEKAGLERAAVLQRERAAAEREWLRRFRLPGAIDQWLVLAPMPLQDKTHAGALQALDQEQISPEAKLRPRAGQRVKAGAGELVWNALRQEDCLIDFNVLLGRTTEWSAAYAICYLQSEAAQTGVLMKVSSDDQAKIYLNGKQIYRNDAQRQCVPDQDVVTGVELKAGLNVLVFKVVNEIWSWQGSVRFTDAAGQPVKGIKVTLDPDAKD